MSGAISAFRFWAEQQSGQKNNLIITDFGEAESESIPLKITEGRGERLPVTVRAYSQGSPESVIIRYDQNFFYDPTQRHGDHREKTVPPCSPRLCVGYRAYRDCGPPESVIIRK